LAKESLTLESLRKERGGLEDSKAKIINLLKSYN
jgi:hypothetical protein